MTSCVSCTSELQLSDEGTLLLFPITECIDGVITIVDLTSAQSLTIRFEKFEAEEGTFDVIGSIYTGGSLGDGRDGIIKYITQPGDIDALGKWKAQGIVVFADGKFHTSVNKDIKVLENLPQPVEPVV